MALTETYVDPSIAANSGSGTIGDPYGDLQYALNTMTRDATNGDRINIKAGTAEVLTAAISLATYGTPTSAAPIEFRGYTSAAGDGGIGEVSGNATYGIFNSSGAGFTRWCDLKIGNCGGNLILWAGTNTNVNNCEIHTNTTHGVALGGSSHVSDSWIHDCGLTYALSSGGTVCGCFVDRGTGSGNAIGIQTASTVVGCIVRGFKTGISVSQNNAAIGNTVIGPSGVASAIGISLAYYTHAINNLVTGHNGTNARGISGAYHGHSVLNNGVWDNTTHVYGTGTFWEKGTVTLSADPFTDASGDDYSTSESALLAALPGAINGLSTTSQAYIGAVQAAGGGVQVARGMQGGMR